MRRARPATIHVLIAGIGVGSLGLELLKCFASAGDFQLFGADISEHAYGLRDKRFADTAVIPCATERDYVTGLLRYAKEVRAEWVAPGAEATGRILAKYRDLFAAEGLELMINSTAVIAICSDKVACSNHLVEHGFTVPQTVIASQPGDLFHFDAYPCVVKPAKDSGGSNMVFLAETRREANFFVRYLSDRGFAACLQQYIEIAAEFTVGVLSSREGKVLSSIALKRNLDSKLSRAASYGNRVISSGWSQGRIDHYRAICEQAERMALALGSTWAINIQGRVRDDIFIPFEVNPRHSGTSYLRAMAGINEPIIAIDYYYNQILPAATSLKIGEYQRLLTEHFFSEVPK